MSNLNKNIKDYELRNMCAIRIFLSPLKCADFRFEYAFKFSSRFVSEIYEIR